MQRRLRPVKPAVLAVLLLRATVSAQEPGAYAGGTLAVHVQPHAEAEPLGGTTWGGSVLIGAHVSPAVALESETYFSGAFSDSYSYAPSLSLIADVTAQRRDTFFAFQLRIRAAPWLEPVAGVSYVLEQLSRHATVTPRGSSGSGSSSSRRSACS